MKEKTEKPNVNDILDRLQREKERHKSNNDSRESEEIGGGGECTRRVGGEKLCTRLGHLVKPRLSGSSMLS